MEASSGRLELSLLKCYLAWGSVGPQDGWIFYIEQMRVKSGFLKMDQRSVSILVCEHQALKKFTSFIQLRVERQTDIGKKTK